MAYALGAWVTERTPSSQASSRSKQRRRSTQSSAGFEGKDDECELLDEVHPVVAGGAGAASRAERPA